MYDPKQLKQLAEACSKDFEDGFIDAPRVVMLATASNFGAIADPSGYY